MPLAMLLDSASSLLRSFFNTFCIGTALVWLTYRAYLVLNKPLDDLVALLGFEIPQGPQVDLAGVKADGAILVWKPADDRRTSHKYEVQVNGATVGEVSQSESPLLLSNLHADHLYIIRIIVVNSLDFRSASEPLRICTKPASSADFFNPSPVQTPSESPASFPHSSPPVVRPFKSHSDVLSNLAVAPPMLRETSNGPSAIRGRILAPRRNSPNVDAPSANAPADNMRDPPTPDESQHRLTEKLDEIARETAEVDKQIQEEEQEALSTKSDLQRQRDELRADLKEKDNTSRELKKQVNVLEREHTAALSKKTNQERALSAKLAERQKLKDDAARWERQVDEMRAAVIAIANDKQALRDSFDKEKQTLLEKQAQEANALRAIGDEIKEKSNLIEKLERDTSNSPINPDATEHTDDWQAQEAEEDRLWAERAAFMDDQYKSAWARMDDARRLCQDAYTQWQSADQRRIDMAQRASTVNIADQSMSRGNSTRQRRIPSAPAPLTLSQSSFYPTPSTAPPFRNGMPALSNALFSTSSPFFNMANGSAGDRAPHDPLFSNADIERLTGGAPMSPGVGAALLPAGLLNTVDEDLLGRPTPSLDNRNSQDNDTDSDGRQHSNTSMLPGLGAFSATSLLPGLGAPQTQSYQSAQSAEQAAAQGPASPVSVSSRPPSVFASPGASANNLAFSPDFDADRRSIRSGRSIRASSGVMQTGSRFSQILGLDKLDRRRGKTLSDDGPALGSLSKTQSQSVPKGSAEEAEDAAQGFGRRRNSSLSSNFFNNMLTLKGASAPDKSPIADTATTQKPSVARRRPFNVFGGSKPDGWPMGLGNENRPASPRPVSTHSTELPRPSQESTSWGYGWPPSETFGQRNSPLNSEWGQPPPPAVKQTRSWGSHHASRRPSIQYSGSGSGGVIMEDVSDYSSDNDDFGATQAPIGTRPMPGLPRPPSPRLNPAAKDFKSLFSSFGEKKERSEKSFGRRTRDGHTNDEHEDVAGASASTPHGTPLALLASPGTAEHGTPAGLRAIEDFSPPNSGRRSRDTRSVTTTDTHSTHDYSSRNSLDRATSYPASEALTPSSLTAPGRESFMSKLSRKSSSGKFGLPVFGSSKKARAGASDKGKGREDASAALDEEREDDEDAAAGGLLSRSYDSLGREGMDRKAEKGSAARGWSAMFTSKKNKEKSAAAGSSSAGGGGEETPSLLSEASLTTSEATGDEHDEYL